MKITAHQKKLIAKAKIIRKKAYAPYSKFQVGAALETKSGKVFLGCNVENASYGLTDCAERVAVMKAVSEGSKSFSRIAIVANTDGPIAPCGICRQILFEFSPKMEVIMTNLKGDVSVACLSDLLPGAFEKSAVKKE
ncbi:MAG: cytidine deaminase [Deltaproteobacteria bacterium CG11_big_fil_rev_8_21_14_0_20_42_23]|nr:MAG: cytidine deaminase [Deltaproteobacteria bacterium CG11_big_fil_rev_8_21_14_0_20_42_23]PJC63480.1 MAG: cytidine deaminase [Deltaproteobacteria bacterium CG_4_9_14_0_2_um_filter_42_21]